MAARGTELPPFKNYDSSAWSKSPLHSREPLRVATAAVPIQGQLFSTTCPQLDFAYLKRGYSTPSTTAFDYVNPYAGILSPTPDGCWAPPEPPRIPMSTAPSTTATPAIRFAKNAGSNRGAARISSVENDGPRSPFLSCPSPATSWVLSASALVSFCRGSSSPCGEVTLSGGSSGSALVR